MSRKGENIYRRKDGRWEARYIKAYSIDGKAKYGYCYAASYHELKEKVSLIKAALLSDQPTVTGNVRKRFAVYCEEWLTLNRLKSKGVNLCEVLHSAKNSTEKSSKRSCICCRFFHWF